MKPLCANIAFVTALLIAVSATAQKKSDVSRDQLIGPVHTAQIELAEVAVKDGKEVEIWRRPHQKVVYDQRGNEIERINFNQSGSIENRTVHVVDANARLSGWKEYEIDAGGSGERVTSWSEWLYDKAGNRIEARVYRGKDLSLQTLASYNPAGLITEETMIADGGAWKQTTKYGYDSNGRLASRLIDANGKTTLIEEAHDDAGNLISHKYTGPEGQNDGEVKYVYDAKGREIERNSEDSHARSKVVTAYDSKGRVSRRVTQFGYKRPNIKRSHDPEPGAVEFRYDENDKLVEERAYSVEGTLQRRIVIEYDGDGRMRSQIGYNADGAVTGKAIFERDKWGNCVKMLGISPGPNGMTVTSVQYHLITYYAEK
jgi:YD repeat-containing protein